MEKRRPSCVRSSNLNRVVGLSVVFFGRYNSHNPSGFGSLQHKDVKIFDTIDAEEFFVELRRLQSHNKCTEATLFDIVSTFSKFHNMAPPSPKQMRAVDKKLQKVAGCEFLELHGCPAGKNSDNSLRCDRFIYQPHDRRKHCPKCGSRRFDEQGKPFEV